LSNFAGEVRAVVDGDQIVYKQWSKRKQRWIYHIEDIVIFEVMARDGCLFGR